MISRGLYLFGYLGSSRTSDNDKKKVPRLFYALKSRRKISNRHLGLGQSKQNNYLTRIKIIKEMKKNFLMALSVFLFSTTATFAGNDDNKVANNENNEIEVSIEKADYPYWQGSAWNNKSGVYAESVYLKVYNSSNNTCNSYVADIYSNSRCDKKLGGATVRENPKYGTDKYSRERAYTCKYYITYGGDTYYFNM